MVGGMIETRPLRIFISYSRRDSQFVDRLGRALRSCGHETWIDRENLRDGQDWQDGVRCAIGACDVVLVVVTPDSLDSPHVRMEYQYGHRLSKVTLPLALRSCAVPAELRGMRMRQDSARFLGLQQVLAAIRREHDTAISVVARAEWAG